MFTIIICEDDMIQRREIMHYLEEICKNLKISYKLIEYETGEQLLNNYSLDSNLILLDIHLGQIDGMKVARQIRSMDKDVDIIFVSGSTSYMQEGYEVDARRYLTKPINKEEFIKQVKSCIESSLKKSEEYIWIKSGYSAYKILMHDILYAETYGRKVNIHTKSKIYDTHINLGQVEKMLNQEQFFRCHRGYIINLQQVEGIEKEYITIRDQVIPLSRFKAKALKKALLNIIGE